MNLGEDYNSYIQKYHGFFVLTCQRSYDELTKVFEDESAIETFLKKDMKEKYDNASSFFDYFLKSPNLLVIDIDNVLVTKIPMSTEN